jgi:hypothetical protein
MEKLTKNFQIPIISYFTSLSSFHMLMFEIKRIFETNFFNFLLAQK